jgi:hypothetical protein
MDTAEPETDRDAAASTRDEHAAGRAAAERLSDEWPDVSWVPKAPAEAWANAAVERFAELIREQRAIFRASQRGAGRGARTLSPRPFQGLLEALQNADDLASTELRVGLRSRGRKRDLLIVHDGDRVQLQHVGAMVLPWLTTKEDDPDASGRFGIGQQTLQALGGPLEVHCAPFQVRVETEGPTVCGPVPGIPSFYAPERHETLFVVPLLKTVDLDRLVTFLDELGSESLLFLRRVRRLSVVDLRSGARTIDHRLVSGDSAPVIIRHGSRKLSAQRLEMRDPRSRRRYVRYVADRHLSKDEPQRHEKATATTTPLGIAIPVTGSQSGRLYDRLPMPLEPGFPFSLNAQFDPDAPRTTLLENEWNEHRLRDLGELLAGTAIDAFERDPAPAWRAVPLRSDVVVGLDSWLGRVLGEAIIETAQPRVADGLRLNARGSLRHARELVFEDRRLDGLLTGEVRSDCAPGSLLWFRSSVTPTGAGGKCSKSSESPDVSRSSGRWTSSTRTRLRSHRGHRSGSWKWLALRSMPASSSPSYGSGACSWQTANGSSRPAATTRGHSSRASTQTAWRRLLGLRSLSILCTSRAATRPS